MLRRFTFDSRQLPAVACVAERVTEDELGMD